MLVLPPQNIGKPAAILRCSSQHHHTEHWTAMAMANASQPIALNNQLQPMGTAGLDEANTRKEIIFYVNQAKVSALEKAWRDGSATFAGVGKQNTAGSRMNPVHRKGFRRRPKGVAITIASVAPLFDSVTLGFQPTATSALSFPNDWSMDDSSCTEGNVNELCAEQWWRFWKRAPPNAQRGPLLVDTEQGSSQADTTLRVAQHRQPRAFRLERQPGEGLLDEGALPLPTVGDKISRVFAQLVPDSILDRVKSIKNRRWKQLELLLSTTSVKNLRKLRNFAKRHRRLINDTSNPNFEGNSPFHKALLDKNWGAIRIFLQTGASATKPNTDGYTPIQCLATPRTGTTCCPSGELVLEVVKVLRKRGADLNAVDSDGYTPFQRIVLTGDGDKKNCVAIARALARARVNYEAEFRGTSMYKALQAAPNRLHFVDLVNDLYMKPLEATIDHFRTELPYSGNESISSLNRSHETIYSAGSMLPSRKLLPVGALQEFTPASLLAHSSGRLPVSRTQSLESVYTSLAPNPQRTLPLTRRSSTSTIPFSLENSSQRPLFGRTTSTENIPVLRSGEFSQQLAYSSIPARTVSMQTGVTNTAPLLPREAVSNIQVEP